MDVVGACCAWLIIVGFVALMALGAADGEDEPPRSVAAWPPQGLGNHRVRVHVAVAAPAVWAHILWRRRDPAPHEKAVLVFDATTGRQVTNVLPAVVAPEVGEIVFEPPTVPGDYFIYTMPYTASGRPRTHQASYLPPAAGPDRAWLDRARLTPDRLTAEAWRELPPARVVEIEARGDFHRFDPMELPATSQELAALLARHPDRPYLLFPEDRSRPIRMTEAIPWEWAAAGPAGELRGEASRDEFYVFQIGVFAARQSLTDVTVEFSDLRSERGDVIAAARLNCFNTGGRNWRGRRFAQAVAVPAGRVAALWCGVAVPRAAAPTRYTGTVTIRPQNAPPTDIALVLAVGAQALPDHGDGELWRLSRLRWLDSAIALDEGVTAPYTPLEVVGTSVRCVGRQVTFGPTGLPVSIRSSERELLRAPIEMVVQAGGEGLRWSGAPAAITRATPGAVSWQATRTVGALHMVCTATMEFDGHLDFDVTITADTATPVADIRLEIPLRRQATPYMMGLGRKGGYRPRSWRWPGNTQTPNHLVWIGDWDAGLQCKLKGPTDTWELDSLRAVGLDQTWTNEGKGCVTVDEQGLDTVRLQAATGPRTIDAGDELHYRFALLITPMKPLSPAHWQQRRMHTRPTVPAVTEVTRAGANILNIHHGNDHNPYLNYPFLTVDKLAAYVRAAHAQGVKVTLYYTVRELSNHVAELWPLRSLGPEVFPGNGAGGDAWLREHLLTDYRAAWAQPFEDGEVDAAIATTGLSRWHNYYLEGLRYLVDEVGLDGLYLSGIGFDREVMKRVRKVMDRRRPGCLIDFHCGDDYAHANMKCSPANTYMEHFPYIDSLWFGDNYDYGETPDYWLVEVSGIPFGLFGEMLGPGANPWRGMIYGMTGRLGWGTDPRHLWKLWDDFGIQEARMTGYWDPSCPVQTDHPLVLATVYRKPGKTLVALASWATDAVRCRLKVAWPGLGLDPARAHLYAPAVTGFQPAASFEPSAEIPVAARRGWLLIIDEEERSVPVQPNAYAGRRLVLEDRFPRPTVGEPWVVRLSPQEGTALSVEDGAVRIDAPANTYACLERPLPAGVTLAECRVFSGTDRGATWGPGIALLWPHAGVRVTVRSEGRFAADDGARFGFGGWSIPGTWYELRLRLEPDLIVAEVSTDGILWETIHTLPRSAFPGDPAALRIGKTGPGGRPEDFPTVGWVGNCAVTNLRVFANR